MDPVLRRSSFFYLSHLAVFSVVLGRYLGANPWPAFEVIPPLMPVYLASSILFSERGESYAFLRTLPVTDRRIVRTKFVLMLVFAAVYWFFLMGMALARFGDGPIGPSTLVYITLICGAGLLAGACCQIGIWRFGVAAMTGVIVTLMGIAVALAIGYTASLRGQPGWPVLSQLAPVEWLARSSWLSEAVLVALTLISLYGLMRVGARVKASSEVCL
jgi:hypothetical protein